DTTGGFDQGGWVFKVWDEGVNDVLGGLFSGDYDLLLGRRTYDIFAAYWPYVADDDAGMGEAFTRANKYVLTRGDHPLEWANSHRLKGIEDVSALKRTDGPDLIIQGSGTIYPGLLAAGLIDRLTLLTYPVTLGTGKGIFGAGTPAAMMKMIDHRVSDKGTIVATYVPDGALPPYPSSAPAESTSEREAQRQRRMADGSW
ncbi:MAG: dihydrofolate reductase family protein, partial [Thermoanaerobaculales bacterium]|nr:dihydrofolate reductase family protein [Thermoanaerobaculales bacterium]